MKSPRKARVDDFFAAVQSFLSESCWQDDRTHALICKQCKSRIRMEPVPVALHEVDLDCCVATDTVQFMRIPYCPRCEDQPSPEACIHVLSSSVFFEWCNLHKELSQLLLITDRRRGRREGGTPRRKLLREYFAGDVVPESHHAFARPDVHEVLSDFGYWLDEFDGDLSTYVQRGGRDYIETHRIDGTWRHAVPGQREVEGSGAVRLRSHLRSIGGQQNRDESGRSKKGT